ncbi:MAG: hypothetical protein QOG52_2913, partial [Frankiaceae bacterium]|nr:hypothetical protein [Frankiaceae bacterium]
VAAGLERVEADARTSYGSVLAYTGPAEEGLAELQRGMAIAQRLDDHHTWLRGFINSSDILELLGRHEEAAHVAEQGAALARSLGFERSFGAFLIGNQIEPLMRLGRWAEAERLARAALATGPGGVFERSLLELLAQLHAWRGEYDEARECLDAAAAERETDLDWQFVHVLATTNAEVARGRGDIAGARAIVDRAQILPVTGAESRYGWPLLWMAARIEADAMAVDRRRRDGGDDESAGRVAAIEAAAARLSLATSSNRAYARMVAAELARARGAADVPTWSDAVDGMREARDVHRLAYALWRLAEVACATGDRGAGATAAAEALTIARDLGAAPLMADVLDLVRRARLPVDEPVDPSAADDSFGALGLTERERSVLAHVAAGHSNAQIGDALFISPKTASVHVSNILTKLGAGSRIEAAALAHRLGISLDQPVD